MARSKIFKRSLILTLPGYFLRLFAIQAATLLLAIGSIVYGYLIIPFNVYFLRRDSVNEIRTTISKGIQAYLNLLDQLNLLKLRTVHVEQIDKSSANILIANHPSIFDILFFISLFPTCGCLAKKSLSKYSPYSAVIKWAQYIVESKDSGILEQAHKELINNRPMVIFPQGTRSIETGKNTKLKFHRGAVNLHILSKVKITPVLIYCDPPALSKSHKWYQIPEKVCNVTMKFDTSFTFKEKPNYSLYRGILARKLNAEFEVYYASKLT